MSDMGGILPARRHPPRPHSVPQTRWQVLAAVLPTSRHRRLKPAPTHVRAPLAHERPPVAAPQYPEAAPASLLPEHVAVLHGATDAAGLDRGDLDPGAGADQAFADDLVGALDLAADHLGG